VERQIKTSDFNYNLPTELIAQTPLTDRVQSRLLVLDKTTGAVRHRHFSDITDYLKPGDCLVLNDTRVLPARLIGELSGGKPCEVLLLADRGDSRWECIVRPGKKLREGAQVSFGGGQLVCRIAKVLDNGNRIAEFSFDGIFLEILEKLGQMPLPPYITEQLEDAERYQTVYSRRDKTGSAAAPTAGLHFTQELLEKVRAMGVQTAFVTLNVGLGTFRPVKAESLENHEMHSEYCELSQETADIINTCQERGGRVVCVGTTSCRTVESAAGADGAVSPFAGYTNIFIYPGYEFRAVSALITNFHLPQSTLLMLVSALAGRRSILAAYDEAVRERYRFFSFGDAMLII
jgi:S-adenosylmethionine:tRNA ribosyltransferase-isomerase